MPADETPIPPAAIPVLDEAGLDAVLDQAREEQWTALALVGPGWSSHVHDLIDQGWPAANVFTLWGELEHAPAALGRLTSLTALDLTGNKIGSVGVQVIPELSELTSLNMAGNQIGEAGAKTIARLSSLKSLDLTANQIGDAGALAIAALRALSSLCLGNNKITDNGMAFICSLDNLRKLFVFHNDIGDKGLSTIDRLQQLNTLVLHSNKIGDDGANFISNVPTLNNLYLGMNLIGSVGAICISRLYSLKELSLAVNKIQSSGAISLKKLSNLNFLDVQSSQIKDDGAKGIAHLKELRFLEISNNQITFTGARSIAKIKNLKTLRISGNPIGDAGVMSLVENLSISSLVANDCSIGEIGSISLSRMSSLAELDLSNNQIVIDPRLGSSEQAYFSSSDITPNQIADEGAQALAKLDDLNELNIRRNLIGDRGAGAILESWSNSQTRGRRRVLDLRGNGKLSRLLPPEVFHQTDAQVLIAAWRRFREAEARGELQPLNEAKLLVVGNEAVGKTSLVRYLVDGLPRDRDEKKTPGIVIRREVETAAWREAGCDVRLNIWDFGGQEIMRGTHRYFLTRRSLYLLVVENRREDDQSVWKWLRIIQSRGDTSPVLVVVNKCDDGVVNVRLDEAELRRAYPSVIGVMVASCEPGSNAAIAAIRQVIAETLASDERLAHVRDPLPEEQKRVKEAVAAAAERAYWLSEAEFVRLCEADADPRLRITDPLLQRGLLQLLHDLGTVVAHGLERDRAALRAVTLLDPNWLTSAIYDLLNSRLIRDQDGEFGFAEMREALDPERFPPERHEYVVEMMEEPEIGLCYRLPGPGESRWLMPECLPPRAPDYADFEQGALRFRYRYELLPPGLLPRFIVEAHGKLTPERTVWRMGAMLAVAECRVLVRAYEERRTVEIFVKGPEALRRSALNAVRHDLDVVHGLNEGIGTQARVPLPDDPDVDVAYQHLRKLEEEEGPDHAFWPEAAGRKYRVAELLDGVRGDGAGVRRPALLEHAPPVDVGPPPAVPLPWSTKPWFPFACGGAAMLIFFVLLVIPSNTWRAIVGGVLGVGVLVTTLASYYAPERYYKRQISFVIAAGLLIHATGFAADAGFFGSAVAWISWNGQASIGFSLAWPFIVGILAWADRK